MTVLPRPAPRAPSRFRTPSIGPLILPAWAVGLSALTVSTFVVDHAVPLVWSGAPLLLTLGRVAGLLAAGQLLLQLVLAARPPALERRYGLDRVLRAHGANGLLLVGTVGLHVGLVVLGGALLTGAGPAYAVQLVTGSTPMLLAPAGLV